MNKITKAEWKDKLVEREQIIDGVKTTCPNGLKHEDGKPDIVWAYYNGRIYEWELVE